MLLLATRHVLPTTPHATRSSHLDCFISQGGVRMWGKRCGTGTALTCQPPQCRSLARPETGLLLIFCILMSHPLKQDSRNSLQSNQPQQETMPESVASLILGSREEKGYGPLVRVCAIQLRGVTG